MVRTLLFASLACGTLAAVPAVAVPLAPNATLDSTAYFDTGEVLLSDDTWYGTLLGTFMDSATETRDGFNGFEVVEDLYSVTIDLTVDVYANSLGTTTFAYTYSSSDNVGVGVNGSLGYSVAGFEGWDVEVGWTSDVMPYVPLIDRSADGDSISVGYLNPTDSFNGIETLLFRTNAPTFTSGLGEGLINIDTFGEIPVELSGLAAPAAIPLPPSIALLFGGLAGIAAIGRLRSGRRTG